MTTRVVPAEDDRRPTDPELQGVMPSPILDKKNKTLKETLEYWDISPVAAISILIVVAVLVGVVAVAAVHGGGGGGGEIMEDMDPTDHFDSSPGGEPNEEEMDTTDRFDVCSWPPGRLVTEQKISILQQEGDSRNDIQPGDAFGRSIAPMGDVDGNGVADLAVGTSYTGGGRDYGGSVYIILLSPNHDVLAHKRIGTMEDGKHTVGGLAHPMDKDDMFGSSVASLGDLDGNGVSDLIVGASGDDSRDGTVDKGAFYVLFMLNTGEVKSQQKISSEDGVRGEEGVLPLSAKSGFGERCAVAGDVDWDNGVVHVLATTVRRVYLMVLNLDGTVKSATFMGDTRIKYGGSMAAVGDIDGNGVMDLVVGDPLPNVTKDRMGAGSVRVVLLKPAGPRDNLKILALQTITPREGGVVPNLAEEAYFGFSVAGLGDLDGDGTPDIAVGAVHVDRIGPDNVHILLLRYDGSVKGHSVIVSATAAGGGMETRRVLYWDQFGSSIATLVKREDSQEGLVTLAVGAMRDSETVDSGGAVYILTLPPGFVDSVCAGSNKKCIRSQNNSYRCG